MNISETLRKFRKFTIILGTITLGIGIIGSFLPGIWLSYHYGIRVTLKEVLSIMVLLLPVFGVSWIADGLIYYPILGLAGTYLGWLTGNVTNLRGPCSVAAQLTAGVEEGTDEGGIISVISIAVSSFVTITIISISALAASTLLNIIPENIRVGFNYILPALLGALVLQFGLRNFKILVLAVGLVLVINLIAVPYLGLPAGLVNVIAVIGTIVISLYLYKRGKKAKSDRTSISGSES